MAGLVWRSGNGVRHINKLKLRRARLVLGLVCTVGGIFRAIQAHSALHPSVGRCSEYWQWFRPTLGKKWQVLRSSRPCYPQNCRHTGLLCASLIGSNPRRLKWKRGWAASRSMRKTSFRLKTDWLATSLLECWAVQNAVWRGVQHVDGPSSVPLQGTSEHRRRRTLGSTVSTSGNRAQGSGGYDYASTYAHTGLYTLFAALWGRFRQPIVASAQVADDNYICPKKTSEIELHPWMFRRLTIVCVQCQTPLKRQTDRQKDRKRQKTNGQEDKRRCLLPVCLLGGVRHL